GGQLTVDLRGASNGAVINALAVGPAIQPPQVNPAGSQSDWAGRSATFNVGSFSQSSASQVPLGPWTVEINWGDGSANTVFTQTTVGSLPQVPHQYATPGNYKPIVKVTDSIGMSGSANFDVLIQAIIQPGAAGPKFDFGTASSPVSAGYTAVTETSRYTLAQGYGWLAGTGSPFSRDRGVGSDLNRDLNSSSSRLVFGVDMPDGPYIVTLTMGDAGYAHNGMQVWLEGNLVDTISVAAGQYTQRTYEATVTGGQLTVDVRATVNDVVINGLVINPVPMPPVVTPAAGQFDWAGRLTTFSIGSFSEFYSDKTQLGPWTIDVDWGDGSAHTVFKQSTTGVLPLVPHLYGTAGTYRPTVKVTDVNGRMGTATFKVDVAASAPGQVASSYVLQPPSDGSGDIDTHSDDFNLILGPGALAGAARVTLTTSNGDGTF
ncbi:MAG: hypothetical protein J0I18_04265, partial [Actinobacteria bacterium]|nr:hypothetical protein [Actinomycetota bacterium]